MGNINNNILESEEDLELKRIKIIAPSKRTMSEISYLKSRSIVKKGIIKSNHYETTQRILEYELNLGDEVQIMPEIRYVEIQKYRAPSGRSVGNRYFVSQQQKP